MAKRQFLLCVEDPEFLANQKKDKVYPNFFLTNHTPYLILSFLHEEMWKEQEAKHFGNERTYNSEVLILRISP